uniref:CARD- and ANK-containing Inflammasome Adaptor Protein n=1 Tax=Sphaeramia orbicularis TaxID=375764 RepID=A0A672ZYD4_9TELE
VQHSNGHLDTVRVLLKEEADMCESCTRDMFLHMAAKEDDWKLTELLLQTNADTPDKAKKTALHLAAMEGNVDAVTSLLSHKVKAGAKDMDGSTPLHYAAAGGFVSIVSLLLQSLKKKGLEERNAWRKTPLHAAAEKGHDNVAVLLLEAGAKINTTDHNKDTPLHCAAQGGHLEMVKRLVGWGQSSQMGKQKKVNLQATNKVGKTPLQIAETGDTPQHESILLQCQSHARITN